MSLPDEQLRSLESAYGFLVDLLWPSRTPRVPRAVRERARAVLRHWPGEFHLRRVAEEYERQQALGAFDTRWGTGERP